MSEQSELTASFFEPSAPSVPPWHAFQGPTQRWPRVFDALLALLALLLTFALWRSRGGVGGGTAAAVGAGVAALVGNGAVYWRRRLPLRVHWTVMGASCAALLAGAPTGLLAMGLSLFCLGRYAGSSPASLFGLLASLLFAARGVLSGSLPGGGSVAAVALVVGVWYLGRRLRFRAEYLRLLEERATYLEAHRRVVAEQAVASERARIARELHDIVAHQVSLMTVQAGAAKTVALDAPEAAREAMGAVERAGRQALGELRHLLGVLRPDREASFFQPQPRLSELPQLVERLAEAGLEVSLEMDQPAEELPVRLELAGYRIVQEALTNVLKHAGPGATARVAVVAKSEALDVVVEDTGTGAPSPDSGGHGLAGMRERAQLLGGSLLAGPRPGGGFRVEAHLPLGMNSGAEPLRIDADSK